MVTDFGRHRGTEPPLWVNRLLGRVLITEAGSGLHQPRHQRAEHAHHRTQGDHIQTVPGMAVPPMLRSHTNGCAMTTRNDMLSDELL